MGRIPNKKRCGGVRLQQEDRNILENVLCVCVPRQNIARSYRGKSKGQGVGEGEVAQGC